MQVFCKDGFQDDEINGIIGYLEDQEGDEVGSVEIKFQTLTLFTYQDNSTRTIDTSMYESDDQDCINEVKEVLFEPGDLEPDDQLITEMIDKANTFELHF